MEKQARLARWLAVAALTWSASFAVLYTFFTPGGDPSAPEFLLLTFALPVAWASVATFLYFGLPPDLQRHVRVAPVSLAVLLVAPLAWLAFRLWAPGLGDV